MNVVFPNDVDGRDRVSRQAGSWRSARTARALIQEMNDTSTWIKEGNSWRCVDAHRNAGRRSRKEELIDLALNFRTNCVGVAVSSHRAARGLRARRPRYRRFAPRTNPASRTRRSRNPRTSGHSLCMASNWPAIPASDAPFAHSSRIARISLRRSPTQLAPRLNTSDNSAPWASSGNPSTPGNASRVIRANRGSVLA